MEKTRRVKPRFTALHRYSSMLSSLIRRFLKFFKYNPLFTVKIKVNVNFINNYTLLKISVVNLVSEYGNHRRIFLLKNTIFYQFIRIKTFLCNLTFNCEH